VWSIAFRRDAPSGPEIEFLQKAIEAGDGIFTTGLVLQELLQGFHGPRARNRIVQSFSSIPAVTPAREDHIEAAALRNLCRRKGIQTGTIDVLLAQLCIRHRLEMLTTDGDFARIARVAPLSLVRL
jgi:predicted nucleic acid-binding protein